LRYIFTQGKQPKYRHVDSSKRRVFSAMVVVYSLCGSKFESKFHQLPWKGVTATSNFNGVSWRAAAVMTKGDPLENGALKT
jgi:hypothetical protein